MAFTLDHRGQDRALAESERSFIYLIMGAALAIGAYGMAVWCALAVADWIQPSNPYNGVIRIAAVIARWSYVAASLSLCIVSIGYLRGNRWANKALAWQCVIYCIYGIASLPVTVLGTWSYYTAPVFVKMTFVLDACDRFLWQTAVEAIIVLAAVRLQKIMPSETADNETMETIPGRK
jgi:hypothetical protein